MGMGWVRAAWLLAGIATAGVAHGIGIASVSPLGEVAQARQVVVRFDGPAVAFGEAGRPDPVALACRGGVPAGSGRWTDDRTWVYDFREPLAPGLRCTVKARAEWQPLGGQALAGRTEFAFATGGPAVLRSDPPEGLTIEEDQHFLLHLSGPAVPASVAAHAWCEAEGLGDRIPVRVVTGAVRDDVLRLRRVAERDAPRRLLLACQRPLPPDAEVRLVWGAGIAAQADPAVVTRTPQRLSFRVRAAFTAEFGCERERARAPCLPLRPLTVRFSAPVALADAQQVRLRPDGGAPLVPKFGRDDGPEVTGVSFAPPLPVGTRFTVELPPGLKDTSGRPLANASAFPLAVATGEAPPIAKFAAAPFGVLEHAAPALLPVTLRHVQGELRPAGAGGQVRERRIDGASEILKWYARVRRFHEGTVTAREAGRPPSEWTTLEEDTDARGRKVRRRVDRQVDVREVSLLRGDAAARPLALPQLAGGDPRPFEVVGIPLPEPGFHVVEIESARLGASLLDKAQPMFVRTGVLVTNLGVHFKHGRENSLAWVTTLDRGAPVAGAEVAVHDCRGKPLWSGRTGADGVARIEQVLTAADGECPADDGLFVVARAGAGGGAGRDGSGAVAVDTAFVFSSWQQGIEPWRFEVPVGDDAEPDVRAHTVFDRVLLRAGETVSMKHFVRRQTRQGLALLAAGELPDRLHIEHVGSGQTATQPLAWPAGARSAVSAWRIPPAARLGLYRVRLEHSGGGDSARQRQWDAGEFRVEAFRVPLLDARLSPPAAAPVAPQSLALGVQLNYTAGGPVARAPLRASALLQPRAVSFPGREAFRFEPPRERKPPAAPGPEAADEEREGGDAGRADGRLVADKVALATDAQGAAALQLQGLPAVERASEIVAEVSFEDPSGETQTVSATVPVWPSAVVLGLRTGSWTGGRERVKYTVLALDTAGRALAGQAVEVQGRLSRFVGTRKRMVGGFYAYDNRVETQELGVLCSGRTDDRGLLACESALKTAGEVELVAQARDAGGHLAQAAASVWVTQQGELWFEQDNDDRIDVLPDRVRYAPGETARLQVRMPFRQATALVSVEREGVIDTRVVTLRGDDPTVELKIDPAWGPNVYVSVLAVRGRVREYTWRSFFGDGGWRSPLEWARSFWYEGREYRAPGTTVDLSRPSFKLGVATLRVGTAAHELQVRVSPERERYAVRQTVRAKVSVTRDGRPAAGAEVAFAAVDEGLLALLPNASWALHQAMLQERAWGVQTSTAQGEIIGRRHYGRKAVPAGGGGGRGGTRELFDTLLLWRAKVPLDARGEAWVEVPLNDSLTAFRLVAVADEDQRFGTGEATVRVTQDLQLLPGLPTLVREGDRFQAMVTLRNTTARPMTVRATLAGTAQAGAERLPLAAAPQQLTLAAGAATEIAWPVEVPAQATSIAWELGVDETGGPPAASGPGAAGASASASAGSAARDRVRLVQRVAEAVPLRVQQATLRPLDSALSMPVQAPAGALPAQGPPRGGLLVAAQPRLGGALPGIRRFFERYPFTCLEQQTSRAIGLRDAAAWARLAETLPTYLDEDGLADYFAPRPGDAARGSDRLTAYLLSAVHEAGWALPPAAREAMLGGLTAFVEGRLERRTWSPRPDLAVRKLAAIEALARHGRAQPRQLGSIELAPERWPTAAVIDWVSILKRVPGIADRERRLAQAQQVLRGRLSFTGTTLRFADEAGDFWWWLMDSPDANAVRLILAVVDDPAWRDDVPALVVGSLARQQGGAWLTTTANAWGVLALERFSAAFESVPVTGRTVAAAAPGAASAAVPGTAGGAGAGAASGATAAGGAAPQSIDWSRQADGGRLLLPWPLPSRAGTLEVRHEGTGRPWLTVQSLAAVAPAGPVSAGYAVTRSVAAVSRKDPARWSRGDVLRVRLEIDAAADMTWVVASDPVPAGAAILGTGLGRDSALAARGERSEGSAWAAHDERGAEAFRRYWERLPRGRHVLEYTLRLNNPGRFALPPTRVEAMYAPQVFGELPNAAVEVAP